jgi:cell division protein FtsL
VLKLTANEKALMLTLFANELAFNVGVLAFHRRVLTLNANELVVR